uniref:Major facilitator superfamily (MFS) profile domain-containing protein n=1 Tax=Theileria parva TaxID=5875 RepID=Q4MZH6_THEPA|eukprot:XP_763571.1 hypothetical protein [Theileria parva strain Muguga]
MGRSRRRRERRKFTFPTPKPVQKLITYIFMILLTGCTYWGWSGIQEILYKAGSYEHLCENVLEKSVMIIGGKEYTDCGPRKSGINNLFTIAFSSHFISSVFIGAILDNLGSKYVYIIGQALNFIAWVFIGALPKVHCVLVTAFFIIGITAEAIYMPLLSLSYSFESKRSAVIGLMGCARTVSYLVPSLMSMIYQIDFFKPQYLYIICTVYAIVGNLGCLMVGFLMVDGTYDNPLEEPDEEEEILEIKIDSSKNLPLIDKAKKFFEKALTRAQLKEYGCLAFSNSIFLTAIGFVNKANREMLITSNKKTAVEIFKYLNVLSFIPGPILGKLADTYGADKILWTIQCFGLGYYVFTGMDFFISKICACVCYFVSSSLCVSINYYYINQRFPRKYFGVLVGFIFFIAGLTNLFNIPLYNLGSKTWEHIPPYNFMRGCMVAGLMGAGYLLIVNKKTASCTRLKSKSKFNQVKEEPDKFLAPSEDVLDNVMMTSQEKLENLISGYEDPSTSLGDVELGADRPFQGFVAPDLIPETIGFGYMDSFDKEEII